MIEKFQRRMYSQLFNLATRIAPSDVRAVQNEVVNRGLKAYEEARTVKTEDMPFMRKARHDRIVKIIIGLLEEHGDHYDLSHSPSIRQLALNVADLVEGRETECP